MSAGSQIAAEIAAALIEAGEAVGAGKFPVVLDARTLPTTPWAGSVSASYAELHGIDTPTVIRDRDGTVVAVKRTLTVNATGAVPQKGQRVAVGITTAQAATHTDWLRIMEVKPFSPAGVPLLYELEVEA